MFDSSFEPEACRRHAAYDDGSQSAFVYDAGQKSSEYDMGADDAIDAALRCVPLPDGLLTRLNRLVRILPDESADHVDWLGC